VTLTPPADPAFPDDDDPALYAGHVNILAEELARLFGSTPQAVREHAAEAALDVVNRHPRQEQQQSGGG
jgi:predicted transcriptional regulator